MGRARLRLQRGATLIELLIALVVAIILFMALYALVDASNKITKQQTEVADVQQSARIGVAELSRIIRQTRVGGLSFGNAILPIANNYNGAVLTNADNSLLSYGGLPITDLSGTSHAVRLGTDVIEVRGVLFGDKYVLNEGNVVCSGSCTVTIPSKAGPACNPVTPTECFVNFSSGTTPSLASKTRPFYFVVQVGENQQITLHDPVNGDQTYVLPIYVAGLVDPGSFSPTPDAFTFTMNPQDPGAQRLNATYCGGPCASSLAKSTGGGAVDVVRFFVDDRGDTHPSLAEAIWDPSAAAWDVQTLIEEVEDFQVAYGVDGADGSKPHNGGVSPAAVNESVAGQDEWVGNVAGEIEDPIFAISVPNANHGGVDAFFDTSILPTTQPQANPALRSVWISLVVKSADPDLVYDGPGARGIKTLDSDLAVVSLSTATGRPYRRRTLSLAVSLRNNAFFNK